MLKKSDAFKDSSFPEKSVCKLASSVSVEHHTLQTYIGIDLGNRRYLFENLDKDLLIYSF